jgi:diguanylate cyclase (GGDEF)-like protein/PAS domain S-box-containing protein
MRVLNTLGRAFTSSRVAMAVVDLDGCWVEVNPALCRLLGRPADELLGRPLLDVTHPDDIPPSVDRVERLAHGAEDLTFEKRYVRGDGTVVWTEVTSSVARDDAGEPEAIFSQILDITDRKQSEGLLRETQEAFARAFEDAPIGMSLTVSLDGETRIARVNPAFCEIFRATPEEILATVPRDLVHPDDLEASTEPWQRMVTGEAPRFSIEQRMLRLDGSAFWAAVHGSLVRAPDGTPLYVITQVQDVTHRKEGEAGLRAAERRFRSAFEDAGTAMALLGLDWSLLRVNRALCELLGRQEGDLLGGDVRALLHPEEVPVSEASIMKLLSDSEEESCTRDVRWERPDGELVWTRLTASLVRGEQREPLYFVVQVVDMTAEREARELAERRIAQQTAVAWLGQRALADADLGALFAAALNVTAATLDASHAGLARSEGGGRLRLICAVGWDVGATLRVEPRQTQAGFTLTTNRPVLVDDLAAEERFDASLLVGAGVRSGISCVVNGVGAEPWGVLSIHSVAPHAFSPDDTAFLTSIANVLTGAIRRDAAARDLRHQSLHDPLTALPNRVLLLDRLRQGLARARRDGTTLGVLFCDMDDFKYVNDSLGHDAGDRLLATLAPRLQEALRGTDTLARFGGDEFVVVCDGLRDASEVVAVADRLLCACAEPVDLGGRQFVPTASIGIAIAPPGADVDPEGLLRDADVAMYGAKSRGKGRYELFDARMRASTLERIALISDLRHAVARDELELVYQPIVSLARREVSGLESLVRWRHPERGLLMPGQFIGLAEDNGLIHELGGWVLREAICQAAAWQRARTPVLSDAMVGINVSWRQVSQPSLVDEIVAALDEHGLDPRFLCVEVTESALMEDRERAMVTLGRLRALGVHLALDDFGTGQSSLSVLRDFPLHTLKLDRSFLSGEGEWAIVEAVCQMARSMELLVVAEGVEEPHQAERVARLGCDFGQGWLYCRPQPADAFQAAVADLAEALRRGEPGVA